jgi:hypothetical protein
MYPNVCLGLQGLDRLLCSAWRILNILVPVLIALGVVYLVWGIVQYVIGDSDEAKKKGREKMIWGIIGLTVIIALWGLVYLLANTFGLGGDAAPSPDDLRRLLPGQPTPASPPGKTIMETPGLFPG